ncbi:MAG: FAD-dependent monooxygenase [Saprospiraceae bacterium]
MSAVKKVLVVGGGIGGQSVAIALAKAGIQVEIVEILKEYNVYGVGIIQQLNALKALDKLGIADEAMRRGFAYGQVKMFTAGGHFIGKAGAPPMGKYPSHNGISRRILHDVMYEEAQRLNIPYRMGITVTEIENNADGVDVTFTDGTKDSYDILVGADGIKSKVRGMIFGELNPRYLGVSVWRYPFPMHEDLDTGQMYYGKKSKIGFIPMNADSMYMFMVSHEGDENRYIDKAEFVPMMKGYLEEFSAKIAQDANAQLNDTDLVNYRPIEGLYLSDSWYKNRVIVIGDGAHATAPQLGSGAALAIEDAVVLVEELEKVDSVAAAFDAFMKRRYERCMMVVNGSETLAEWERLEFKGLPLPEGANHGQLIGRVIGGLMAPF